MKNKYISEKQFIIITHRVTTENVTKKGGIDLTVDLLRKDNHKVYLIEHPIWRPHKGSYFKESADIKDDFSILKKSDLFPSLPPFRWLSEILFNLFYSFRFIEGKAFVIAADPLNFLSAYLLKITGKADKIFFHSVDYSDKRFNNKILNFLYQSLYNFSVRRADAVFAVSGRMFDYCRKISSKDNVIFFPNVPVFDSVSKIPIHRRNNFDITTSSGGEISRTLDFNLILKVMEKLKQKFPQVKLNLIGRISAEAKKRVKDKNLENNVIFWELQPHPKALDIASKSRVGLTLYSSNAPNTYWGDSLKIREFAAMGVPTVSDDKTITAFEMAENKAGVIRKTAEEIAREIERLFLDNDHYRGVSKNALKWAKKMDRKVIFERFKDVIMD